MEHKQRDFEYEIYFVNYIEMLEALQYPAKNQKIIEANNNRSGIQILTDPDDNYSGVIGVLSDVIDFYKTTLKSVFTEENWVDDDIAVLEDIAENQPEDYEVKRYDVPAIIPSQRKRLLPIIKHLKNIEK